MPARAALLTALILPAAAAACGSPTEPSGPSVPTGRYALVHIRGEGVPGWVRSACSAFPCDSAWVQGGTLEFSGGNACIWTLETLVGTERKEGHGCILSLGPQSIGIRIGTHTGQLTAHATGLTITFAECSTWASVCWQKDWWVYRKVG